MVPSAGHPRMTGGATCSSLPESRRATPQQRWPCLSSPDSICVMGIIQNISSVSSGSSSVTRDWAENIYIYIYIHHVSGASAQKLRCADTACQGSAVRQRYGVRIACAPLRHVGDPRVRLGPIADHSSSLGASWASIARNRDLEAHIIATTKAYLHKGHYT